MIDLSKRFDDRFAVRDLTLGVPCGSILAMLGPSGSGKTTTLRLLAGFETPDAGRVMVDDLEVTHLPPVQRHFGMVFQHYALFPHLNVGENVAFGLAGRGTPDERRRRVAEVLALVDLAGFEERKVGELSGGQQQRVAVARALAPEPTVLLLDEPLSNLDPSLRERTRRELRSVLVKTGVTTVFVTHEQEEAFALADRIAVLHEGRLEQIGTAQQLYDEPATLFVAMFVGRASTLPGVATAMGRVRLDAGTEWAVSSPEPLQTGGRVQVVVRPEALKFSPDGGLPGTVREYRYTGARAFFQVEVSGALVEVEAPIGAAEIGQSVRLSAAAARAFPDQP
ncbi:MAG: ABC transporter ATP-binding protein [Gemmatimonadetes bacterium]|nr:ABC transporter ATP-binding protein [Gemmatimonadota bacterium]